MYPLEETRLGGLVLTTWDKNAIWERDIDYRTLWPQARSCQWSPEAEGGERFSVESLERH